MILKLVMPPVDRMIQGGTIIRWYKVEGERVEYGDDLFDMMTAQKNNCVKTLAEQIKQMTTGKVLAVQDILDSDITPDGPSSFVRVTSSDVGYLRRIYSPEGTRQDIGALLAVLTTDRNESPDLDPSEACVFRVVANVLEFWANSNELP